MAGRLYAVGVGPGDPELLTLKAARIIRAAPVVAYHSGTRGVSIARSIVADLLGAGRDRGAADLSGHRGRDRAPARAIPG